jgi:hypothetical protein
VGSKPGASQFHLFSHFHHSTAEPQRLPRAPELFALSRVPATSTTAARVFWKVIGKKVFGLVHLSRSTCLIDDFAVTRATQITGWPDWANFPPLGHLLLWAVFEIYRRSPRFFTTVKVADSFLAKRWAGLNFGPIFHKLIRSPWPIASRKFFFLSFAVRKLDMPY